MPLVNAGTLNFSAGTAINSAGLNLTINIVSDIIVDEPLTITDTYIQFLNIKYTGLETEYLNFNVTDKNRTITEADLPHITTSTGTQKVITTTLTEPTNVTATITLQVPGSSGNIKYYSAGNNYNTGWQTGSYTLDGDRTTLSVTTESGNNNLELDYSCSPITKTSYSLVMLLASVGLIAFLAFRVYYQWQSDNGFNVAELVILFISVIVSVTLWLASGQQLGGQCPVK